MSRRTVILTGALIVVLAAGLAWQSIAQSVFPVRLDHVEPVTLAANSPGVDSFRFPFWVLHDQNGPIGQVFGFDVNGPVVQFSEGGRAFYTIVRGSDRLITNTTIGYTSADCTGTPYLQHPNTNGGWFQLIGATYAYRGTGNSTVLYRVLASDSVAGVTLNSRWSNSNDNCIGNGFSDPVAASTVTVDINFPVSFN